MLLVGAGASLFLLAGACVLLFFKHRLDGREAHGERDAGVAGYALGLAGALLALPALVWAEVSLAPWNTWIFLNSSLPPVVTLQEVLRILTLPWT